VFHVADSILTSVKKLLGIDESYTAFDPDILMHINTAFGTLNQLGIGPTDGFEIEDDTPTWDDFQTDVRMNGVKTYVVLRVRLLFDPPTTSYAIEAMKNQVQELEWRLNVVREGDSWTPPVSV
jgi:hypothetical protein